METLPVTILQHIASLDVPTYTAMLAIPAFARYLLADNENMAFMRKSFIVENEKQRCITWTLNGNFHREDGPAIRYFSEDFIWYKFGCKHRDEKKNGMSLPAMKAMNSYSWYINGRLHREDGPAKIDPYGNQEWYLYGKLHREDGPAKIDQYGNLEWYLYGELHREDDPATILTFGLSCWYQHGKCHREDGPAVKYNNGMHEYCIHDEYLELE